MYSNLVNKEVIVDVCANIVYLGILDKIEDEWIQLKNVDVHDMYDSNSNKEEYIRNMKVTGIIPNRQKCRIDKSKIISISLFSEINEL